MKHKKYLRKKVDGDDSENVSGDDKEDDESSALSMKFIKKEGDERDDLVNPTGLEKLHYSYLLLCFPDDQSDKNNEEAAQKSLLQQRSYWLLAELC